MSHQAKQILSGMLSFAVVLLLLEGISRIATTFVHDYWALKGLYSQKWFELSPELGWQNNRGFKGSVDGTYRDFDNREVLLNGSSPGSERRKWIIAFIGDSNTFGYGVPKESTFVELLGNLWPDVSTINLGVIGYTSYQGLESLRKFGFALHADLIVVSFNFNDRRFVLRREDVDGALHFQNLYREARREGFRELLRRCYVSRALQQALHSIGILKNNTEAITKEVRVDTLHARVDPESYRKNLGAIVETARSRNIGVVFMLLKDSPLETAYLDNGIDQMEHGQHDTAIQSLLMSIRTYPLATSILAHKYLSEAYMQKGMHEAAKNALFSDTKSLMWYVGGESSVS